MTDWNEPIPGQASAIVVGAGGAYLARFPYPIAGGRENAHAAAERWRLENAPDAKVWGYTGRSLPVWEQTDARGGVEYLDRFPPEVRTHADRAYQDGFSDAADVLSPQLQTLIEAARAAVEAAFVTRHETGKAARKSAEIEALAAAIAEAEEES